MIATIEKPEMNEELYEKYRRYFGKTDGYAQNEEALVSQAKKVLANEPICNIVIPVQNISRALLPHLTRHSCSLKTERHTLHVGSQPVISYYIVTMTKFSKR